MSIADMRVKDGRCQRLIKIEHKYNNESGHTIWKTWRDLERIILETKLSSKEFGYKPLCAFCVNQEVIPDEIEVEHPPTVPNIKSKDEQK